MSREAQEYKEKQAPTGTQQGNTFNISEDELEELV